MAQQDLTPQLRTRLNRVERVVGIFVTLATLLLLGGFIYYIYHTAERKGWFVKKVTYRTSLNNAAGLATGQAVKLMGFNVGEIKAIIPNAPDDYFGVTVDFEIRGPYFGYIWTDSEVRVAAADFLGNRSLELLKGHNGIPTVLETNKQALVLIQKRFEEARKETFDEQFAGALKKVAAENPDYNEHALRAEATNVVEEALMAALHQRTDAKPGYYYEPQDGTNLFWVKPLESPALTERLETVVNTLESALPNILDLTNKVSGVLTNTTSTVAEVNNILTNARPIVTNLAVITSNLRDPHGSLGEWILPTNLQSQLTDTLATASSTLKTADTTLNTANGTLQNTDTNLTVLISNLNRSLDNLANMTSNLNAQVQANTNLVTGVNQAIVHSDEFIQGLKHHWLLRSAFKTNKTQKAKSAEPVQPLLTPRQK